MRRIAVFVGVLIVAAAAGCTVSDALFAVLGRYQSDAYSDQERQMNYADAVERAERNAATR